MIRRLLKKTNSSDSLKQPSVNSEDNNDLTGGQMIVLDYYNDNEDNDDNDDDDDDNDVSRQQRGVPGELHPRH